MHCFLLSILIAANAQQTGGENAAQEQVERLIEDLSAQKFSTRQAATAGLLKLGRTAVPALRKARENGSPEVRDRVDRLLGSILGTRARAEFLKQPTLAKAKQMQIWSRVRKLTGSDERALKTLERWFRAEPRLFETRVVGGRELSMEVRQRASRLSDFASQGTNDADVLTSAQAILFVATDKDSDLDRRAESAAASVLQLRVTQRALVSSPTPDQLTRQLGGAWVSRPGRQYEKLVLTLKFALPEGLPLAESIVRSKAAGARMEYALHVIGKLGGPEQIELLRTQLSNATRLSSPRVGAVRQPGSRPSQSSYQYQVRDIALAMLWHLHGEHPAEHGFDSRRIRKHAWYVFSLGSLGFSSDEARDAARGEWARFAAALDKP